MPERSAAADKDQVPVFNGVFMGGGAKGLAYVGALRAARGRLSFASVAGSSAGAITATLVAADLPPEEFEQKAAEGMAKISRQLLRGSLPFAAKTLFRIDRLESWLDEVLHDQVARAGVAQDQAGPVTFKQLFEASGIELNVVAMDLHRRQPVVFNHQTTPECQVARAVIASCAIPVAMPAGRVLIREADGSERVHRLVDGGAWANYPAFVYKDPSFRTFHNLDPVPAERRTLGFVLEPKAGTEQEERKPLKLLSRRHRGDDLGAGVRAGPLGMLLNWPFLRGLLAVVFPVAVAAVLLDWFRTEVGGFFPSLNALPDGLEPATLTLLIVAGGLFFVLALVVAIGLYRFAKEAFDIGLPALLATVSVGPRVPDWVGDAEDDHVIRLSVEPGISTISFRIPEPVRVRAIDKAYAETSAQLTERFPDLPPASAAEAPEAPAGAEQEGAAPSSDYDNQLPRFGYAILLFVGLLIVGVSIPMIGSASSSHHWWGGALLVLICIVIVVALLYGGARLHRRVIEVGYKPTPFGVILGLLVWGTLTAVLGYGLVEDRGALSRLADGEQQEAQVVSTCCDGASNRLIDLRVNQPIPNIDFRGDGSIQSYCPPPNRSTTCLAANTDQKDFQVGDRIDLWVVHGTGEVFLPGDQWRGQGITARFLLLTTWVAFAVYLLWSVTNAASLIARRRAET